MQHAFVTQREFVHHLAVVAVKFDTSLFAGFHDAVEARQFSPREKYSHVDVRPAHLREVATTGNGRIPS